MVTKLAVVFKIFQGFFFLVPFYIHQNNISLQKSAIGKNKPIPQMAVKMKMPVQEEVPAFGKAQKAAQRGCQI